jgi:hypothetical protein
MGIAFLPGQQKTTDKILMETTLEVSAISTAFQVGETVSAGSPTATGKILRVRTNPDLLDLVGRNSNDFVTGTTLTGGTSSCFASVERISELVTAISAEPYYNPKTTAHTVTASGAEVEVMYLSDFFNTRYLKISDVSGGITIDIYFRSESNTPAVVDGMGNIDDPIILAVNQNVECLAIDFSGAGTCIVEEFTTLEAAEIG